MTQKNNEEKESKKRKSLRELFLEISQVDEDGFSKEILLTELVSIDQRFETGNGGSWCRSDGPLKDYNIIRKLHKGKIYSIKLDGFNKNKKDREISESIRKNILKNRCVVLQVGNNIECDHKDGKYDDKRVANTKEQKIEDFQALSKSVNVAKRQHCKVCNETKKRFDATVLGYQYSFTKGDENTQSCKGCYWYSPKEFNYLVSANFIKER